MKVEFGDWDDETVMYEDRTKIVEVESWDTYDLRSTLSMIIVPSLKKFKEDMDSHPSDMTMEEWEEIIDKMIWSFETIETNWESQFHHGNMDMKFVESKHYPGAMEMVYGPNHTHWYDEEGAKKYCEKIQEGINLFAKHFWNLWW